MLESEKAMGGVSAHDRAIQLLVSDVKEQRLQLPELQRGYVWKSTQVRDFFDSLYHEYPTGQLLVWVTDDSSHARGLSAAGIDATTSRPQLLLDGQQRLTSLYAVMTGKEIVAKEGTTTRAVDIVFNVHTQTFRVATVAERRQSGWVSLTKLFTEGLLAVLQDLKLDLSSPDTAHVLDNLRQLEGIKNYQYRVTVLESLTYAEVTDIFVRINSGGTKLGNADLALAQLSSRWRGITGALDSLRARMKVLGWQAKDIETIALRVLSAILTGRATLGEIFKAPRLEQLTADQLRDAWERVVPSLEAAVQFIRQNCLIDDLSMLPTDYVLVPLALFFDRQQSSITSIQTRDLQRWLYMALIWARYSSSSETSLDQDLAALNAQDPINRMIRNIEDKVGPRRPITERELRDQLKNSPMMVMAYVLARWDHAQDWVTGLEIGAGHQVSIHPIFPKSSLPGQYRTRVASRTLNQVANLVFISSRSARMAGQRSPEEYLQEIPADRLRSQNVPLDRSLWSPAAFEAFLLERRTLLAGAINDLLRTLSGDEVLWSASNAPVIEARVNAVEQQLRVIIAERLESDWGPSAWKKCIPGDIQDGVRQRIDKLIKQKPYEADLYESLQGKLEQCLFSDYQQIVAHNWDRFRDVFGSKQELAQYLGHVLNARNALKHGRRLNQGELATTEGALYWLEHCLNHATSAESDDEVEIEDQTPALVHQRV